MSNDTSALIARLNQSEDPWTERKQSFDERDVRKTVVAFANSVGEGETAVLFIGATNDGRHPGLLDADETQKKVAGVVSRCYPRIEYQTEVLTISVDNRPREVLAVKIPFSINRPHFAGTAHIRKGSESIECPQDVFRELVASQNSTARRLLQYKFKPVILRLRSTSGFRYDIQGMVNSCDAHSVIVRDNFGYLRSFALVEVIIEKDGMDRFVITAPPPWTEEEQIRKMVQIWAANRPKVGGDRLALDAKDYIAAQILANPERSLAAVSAEADGSRDLAFKVLLVHVQFELKKIKNPMSRQQKIQAVKNAATNAKAFAPAGARLTPDVILDRQANAVAGVATSFEEANELLKLLANGDPKIHTAQMIRVFGLLGLSDALNPLLQ